MTSLDNEQPLVSVIMPTYNHAEFIGKAIESVLNQTYQKIEFIIIDNYSEDDTEKIILENRDNRIIYLKFRNNGIIAASRNLGIKKAKGEYIAFLDSDDVWHKQKLEKQLPHFSKPEIIGVASNPLLDSETPFYRRNNFARGKNGYIDYQYRDILDRNPIVTSSLIVRSTAFEHSGYFDENKAFSCIEDWDLWLRVARYGIFRVLECPLLTYFVSRKRGRQAAIISQNCLKILEKQVDLGYVKDDDIIKSKVTIYLAIARNLMEYDHHQSRKYYIKALKTTSSLSVYIKGCTGLLVLSLPNSLRKGILFILYKADWILSEIKDGLWKIIKSFYRVRPLADKSMLHK